MGDLARLRSASFGGAAFAEKWHARPKLRSSEGWRPGLELNQDKERCIAPASTPFRHRAAPIIAYRAAAGHA
jgi:hypothetical protein